MSVDDCFVSVHAPLRERASFLTPGVRYGSLPSLLELDLGETAASDWGTASAACGGGSRGDAGARNRTIKILNRPVAVPLKRAVAPLGPLPDTAWRQVSRDDSGLHLLMPSLCKEKFHGRGSVEPSSALTLQELKDALLGKPKQFHPSEVAVSRTAPRGRYQRSKAGWASKGRSTPEYNRDEHAWRFESPHPSGISTRSIIRAYKAAYPSLVVVHPPKKKKSPEERNAIREKRGAQRQRASLYHVETALHKYNRANNTKFELVEITAKCPFFELGGGCYHYNFTAKPENHHFTGVSTKLFFAEINYFPRSEDDVLLCCTSHILCVVIRHEGAAMLPSAMWLFLLSPLPLFSFNLYFRCWSRLLVLICFIFFLFHEELFNRKSCSSVVSEQKLSATRLLFLSAL